MVTVSFSIVIGTVMLSNDMRNLKAVAHRMGLDWVLKTPVAAKPAPQKAFRSAEPAIISLSPHLLEEPHEELVGGFLRVWRITGPAMCKILRDTDIAAGAWAPAVFDAGAFECSFERIYEKQEDRILSSLFLVVRGNPDGTMANIRIKIVKPKTGAYGLLDANIFHVFETILTQLHWMDCRNALAEIQQLKDVKAECFGTSINFAQETINSGSFNFTLSLRAASGPETKTQNYFSPERWMPLPDLSSHQN